MKDTRFSIRTRLLQLLGAAVFLATTVQAIVAYHVALNEVDTISDYHMQQSAYSLRHNELRSVSRREGAPAEDPDFSLVISPLPTATAVEPHPNGFSTRQIGNKTFRVFSVPTGSMLIEAFHDMEIRRHNARVLAFRTILPILLLGPILMLMVWWTVSRALRPVHNARHEIAKREAGDLRPLPTDAVPIELLPFVQEINALFRRVSDAFAAQQNFVADAAHELRSPLTALRLQVQALQRTTDAEQHKLASARLLSGIDRTSRLVEQMLTLAREEASASDGETCALPQVVRLALSDVLPRAQERDLDITASLSDDVPDDALMIRAGIEVMRRMLRNLLENAVKYTPTGGRIHITLQKDAGQCALNIEDSGPGIPEAERNQAFERFHRGSGHDVEGSGLGLAIVQAIASRHAVQLALDQSPELGGLRVTLRFRAA
ncbi:MAG: ATP-binding protein [Rhodocyclaceae bacterium]